ncbi:hypothetical protein OG393_08575 [Streptomyces sp. NBC_01216]|uniref:hypothetical protein n=1 Tax=Streptomyces sp. NBC_01216 TaxID=2903778 RepID=UPI002E162E9D|nr:hypothetical protein OG393_08575 [Streptomyces sp. NBC_01216]
MSASRKATEAGGNARFRYVLSYRTSHGAVEDLTTGAQDDARHTAHAERVLTLPSGAPDELAEKLDAPTGRGREVYEVAGSDVAFLTRGGDWLRYSASGSSEFAEKAAGVLYRSGDRVPYGGTLADVVDRAGRAEKEPVVGEDGSRRYELTVSARTAAVVLPEGAGFDGLTDEQAHTPLSLNVRLDAEGRLVEATADFAPLLEVLHQEGALREVTELTAAYTLTDFGDAVPQQVAAGAQDTEKLLTELTAMKPGACASRDTGLGSHGLVRPVDCDRDHDLRVFGRVRVDTTSRKEPRVDFAESEAEKKREARFAAAPVAWTARAKPRNTFLTIGSSQTGYSPGSDHRAYGDFTCAVSATGY